MKRLVLIITALALVLGLSQCKKPNQPVYGGGELQTITFSTGNGNDGAKGDFEQVASVLNYKWTENDKIYVYASADGTFGEGHSQFCGILDFESCTQEPDGTYTGVFTNTITMPYSSGKIQFVHYGQDVTVDASTGAASVSFANQNGKLTGDGSVSSKVIASYVTDYNPARSYSGTLAVEFAVVRLSFEKFTDKTNVTFYNIGNTDVEVGTYGDIKTTGANNATLTAVNESYYTVFVKPATTETLYKFDSSKESSHITSSKVQKGLFYTADLVEGKSIILDIDVTFDNIVKGAFSVAPGQKVYFAKGNIQYQASTNTWRFAEHQYDCVGYDNNGNVYEGGVKCDNKNIGENYTGWIDYFGFGSNGVAHSDPVAGKVPCYKPYCVEGNNEYYKVYNVSNKNLYDEDGSADFGYNFTGGWYTLTKDNWNYLIDRPDDKSCDFVYNGTTYNNARFAKIKIKYREDQNINGVLFFPDVFQWNEAMGPVPSYINNKYVSFGTQYTTEQFEAIEAGGGLFMPAAGFRYFNDGPSTDMKEFNRIGDYWTSNYADNSNAYIFQLLDGEYSNIHTKTHERAHGFSVRLVTNVYETYTDDTATNLDPSQPW